jgi:DNA-binding CsgD family transcriptional regulator
MEKLEFYLINGQTCFRREDGSGKPLTPADREAIEFMIERIKRFFPEAFDRLCEWASSSAMNKPYFEYRMVDRFIRCNFGEADFLYADVEDNMFHFEEVKCPLRGICKDESVICKPKANLGLPAEEQRVVSLYSKGYLPGEIAEQLGKAEKTCKEQIRSACKRLKLPHARWLIRLFNAYTF